MPQRKPSAKAPAKPITPARLVALVRQCLDDDKADNIVTIPLAGKSTIADYMVLASGASARHLLAMADHLLAALKQKRVAVLGSEGGTAGNWILIDAGDVIIHLFRPEVRAFYQLENMWLSDAPLASTKQHRGRN